MSESERLDALEGRIEDNAGRLAELMAAAVARPKVEHALSLVRIAQKGMRTSTERGICVVVEPRLLDEAADVLADALRFVPEAATRAYTAAPRTTDCSAPVQEGDRDGSKS